jgi:hypothetical protein
MFIATYLLFSVALALQWAFIYFIKSNSLISNNFLR